MREKTSFLFCAKLKQKLRKKGILLSIVKCILIKNFLNRIAYKLKIPLRTKSFQILGEQFLLLVLFLTTRFSFKSLYRNFRNITDIKSESKLILKKMLLVYKKLFTQGK